MLIGVLGGSFNPIHMGHLILAEFIRYEFNLEKIVFVPAKIPPHKIDEKLVSAKHRYNMVKHAIEDNPHFEVSQIELNREGTSYTVDTLSQISESYPDKDFYFICGADSLMKFETWRNIAEIFRLSDIIIAGRSEVHAEEIEEQIKYFQGKYNSHIFCSKSPFIDISSTQIRDRIKKRLSIKYMVPDEVCKYIKLHGLYGEI